MKIVKNISILASADSTILLDLFFNKDGVKLPVIVYCHGFNGFKDWGNFDMVAKQFAESGFAFAKFNFSHNGTTENAPEEFEDLEAFGNNNYSIELDDLKIVTDWLFQASNPYSSVFDLSDISLIGHSMGGGISIIYASEDDRIKKLVTWASIAECKTPWGSWPETRIANWRKTGVDYYENTRTNQKMPLYFQLYEDYHNHISRLDIKRALSSLTIPILLCHGTADLSVPVECAYELQRAQPNAQLFTLDTDHVFDRKHPWTFMQLPPAMQQVVDFTITFLK